MGVVSWTGRDGPLVSFAEGFRRGLLHVGHPPSSAKHHLLLMGQLNRWMAAEGLEASGLTECQRWWAVWLRRRRARTRAGTVGWSAVAVFGSTVLAWGLCSGAVWTAATGYIVVLLALSVVTAGVTPARCLARLRRLISLDDEPARRAS